MKWEMRVIMATLLAGISDILFGIFAFIVGFQDWWYQHFHVFGMLGVSMIAYAGWHYILMKRDEIKNKRDDGENR